MVYFTFSSPTYPEHINSEGGCYAETKNDKCGDKWGNVLELHTADDPP